MDGAVLTGLRLYPATHGQGIRLISALHVQALPHSHLTWPFHLSVDRLGDLGLVEADLAPWRHPMLLQKLS